LASGGLCWSAWWLDTYPIIEVGIVMVIGCLRSPGPRNPADHQASDLT
jgi:hypothetical protein